MQLLSKLFHSHLCIDKATILNIKECEYESGDSEILLMFALEILQF